MRKIFSILAALTLSVGVWAIDGVKYIDAEGVEQTANNVTEITNASATLTGGWYVVYGADIQTGMLICQGDVRLILADGAKLTTTGEGFGQTPGIQVSGEGNSLTIYAQSTGEQSGQLIANGGSSAAGIGGGLIGSGSYITINGGNVMATGGSSAAGIGGGSNGNGSNITINGGIVTANGGNGGAGIGGGFQGSGSNITINGGEVMATGGEFAAGIGGGFQGSGSNITINGGIVTANGGDGGAGIGGGSNRNGSNITINGGIVMANGGELAAGIGGGYQGSGSNINIAKSIQIKADNNNPPTTEIENNGGDLASKLSGRSIVTIDPGSLNKVKTDAIAAINAAIEGVTEETILTIANKAKTDIEAAETVQAVISIKATALAQMNAQTLALARADAISAVQAAATDAKTAIDAASTYEEADAVKAEYKADIDAIASGAIYNINNATSKGAIDEELLQAKTDINQIKSDALAKIIKINELAKTKAEAVAEILAAGEGIQNTQMKQWIDAAIEDIQGVGTTTIEEVERTKGEILNALRFFKDGKTEGKAEGIEEGKAAGKAEMKAELLGDMGEECTDCTAVEVTNGTTTVILYKPTNVGYIKITE